MRDENRFLRKPRIVRVGIGWGLSLWLVIRFLRGFGRSAARRSRGEVGVGVMWRRDSIATGPGAVCGMNWIRRSN